MADKTTNGEISSGYAPLVVHERGNRINSAARILTAATIDNGFEVRTLGRLWVPENQGEGWICVSEHLPPIYCVRFGCR